MDFQLEAWHWLVLGFLLIVFEIFLPSFTALWFGVGACLVGLILWLFPALSFTAQVVIWVILSAILTVAWFKYLKPLSKDKTMAGLSKEAILGQVGTIATAPRAEHSGIVRFPMPILGSDEWRCRSVDQLIIGDRVSVIDVLGNEVVVRKL